MSESLPEHPDHCVTMGETDISHQALLEEVAGLNLPNLLETVCTERELLGEARTPLRPLQVRPPLPSRYTTRPGERLSRRELMTATSEWLERTEGKPRFIVQGGNRYVSAYASQVYDSTIPDIKVMSVEKAPLSGQLETVLTPDERRSPIDSELLEEVIPVLPAEVAVRAHTMSRAELLRTVAGITLQGPFNPLTSDEDLQQELSTAVACISEGIEIPNQQAIGALLRGTAIADMLRRDEPIYFLDDLFYRGRTLYSLAILMTACGGNPTNMQLTTVCSDIKSAALESPFHTVLRSGVLYPFENSIRTEQGYWQDVGTRYIFTDMGAYWEYLRPLVDLDQSQEKYDEWQSAMLDWAKQYLTELPDGLDMSLVGPLLWLSVYHHNFKLDLDINRIVDQKGYKIGACVPFAQLIDRFIGQEEPVEARRQFKDRVRGILSAIESAALANSESFQRLVGMYDLERNALDFQGLGFMTEQDIQHTASPAGETKVSALISGVAESIAGKALGSDRPIIVGINGVDGSGKTTLAAELHRQLGIQGLPVTVVHIDDFTQPRSRRAASHDPIERYYNNTFDIATLRRAILEPVIARQVGSVVLRHEDPRDSSRTIEHSYSFKPGPSVVIVEGVFVFRPELAGYFDTKIFVDIPLSEMPHRAMERDVPRIGFSALKKCLARYMPTQAHYLKTVQPHHIADIVIDNTDWNNPYIAQGGLIDAQQATT